MGVRDTRMGGLGIGYDQTGAQLNDIAKQVRAQAQAAKEGAFVQIDLPDIDTSFAPIFIPEFGRKKGGYGVTLRYFIPGYTQSLIIHLVKRSDVVDAATYLNRKKEKIKDISDIDRAAQSVEATFDSPLLDPGSTYDVVDLIALDGNGGRHINPEVEADYSGYPGNVIYSLTTPADLGADPAGGPNIIIGGGMMNSLDQFNVLDGGASVAADKDYLGRKWETDVNSGTRISRLVGASWATNGLQWLDTYAVIKMSWQVRSLGGRPSTRIQKRIIAGESYTFSCLMAAEDAVDDAHIVIALSEQGVGDIVLEVTDEPWTFSIWPAWELLVAVLRVPDDFVMANKHWVTMRLTNDLSGGNSAFTTKWKLERGENVSAWTPHQGDEDLLDSQANITNATGHGGFGQRSSGIYDMDGNLFGGPDGLRIGKFIRD